MKKWTKTAGLIFMAAASVYADRAIAARPAKPVSSSEKSPQPSDVKLLEDKSDPFAAVAPTTAPSSSATESTATTGTTNGAVVSAELGTAKAAPVVVNSDGTFSLNITAGADLVEQLRVIGFQAQTSIIPSKEVHGTLPAMDLYGVTVHEALDALLHPNGYAWQEKGKFIYVYSAKEMAEMEKAQRVANTEVFRLYYTPAANAVTMIKPVLSPDAQVAVTTPAKSGLGSGPTDVGGNDHSGDDVIVVTDYQENLDKVRKVLKEVDRRPEQILIEATILSAKLTDNNSLGVDFNVVGGVDFTQLTHAAGQITSADIGQNAQSAANMGETQSSVGSGTNFSNIPGAFRVGVVTDNLSVFLSALEGVTNTTVLANPKVLALNKQKGEVIVGNKDGYITTTQTETTSTQTVEFLDTGTRLVFRPFIGDDGYIRMEIHPEDSSGGVTVTGGQSLPHKSTTEVTSNVMIKDGHTIVIGGLFRDVSTRARSQVPGLGSIPLAGLLFRQQADTVEREEVIILLTPHIIKDQDAYAGLSEEQLHNAEKLRVGIRKGMMWWSSQRLAEMNYEWAVDEMHKSRPDRKRALWFLNAATDLNPQFIEAINMKQELTGKEITNADNSSIRRFVERAMMEDRAPATQPAAEATPTTEPANSTQLTEGPTSQPSTQPTLAEAPTSQPSDTLAENPTSQPAENLAEAPATEPTSQPAVATQDDSDEMSGDADQAIAESSSAAPTSQPSAIASNSEPTVTKTPAPTTSPSEQGDNASQSGSDITELPTDELNK